MLIFIALSHKYILQQVIELNYFQKAKLLPFLLTGTARVLFQSATHLAGKRYDQLCEELMVQFHTDSDIWLLKQQLTNRKQLPSETVAPYPSEIPKLCQHVPTLRYAS